jgi:hypothetical protein
MNVAPLDTLSRLPTVSSVTRSVLLPAQLNHQPEAQHPKSSAIHKLLADYPIFWPMLLKKGF